MGTHCIHPLATALAAAGLMSLSLVAGAQTTPPAPARAASAPVDGRDGKAEPEALQAVIITSQKRPELKKDVPLAVTVTSREQLERQQVSTISDLVRTSPAFEVGDAGSSPGGAGTIRGIGTNAFGNSAEAAVGIVVDGVPQANANISNLFDIDMVEVLRGPQGMLFGQTASAGVLNISTGQPRVGKFEARFATDLSGKDRAGSRYGEKTLRGVVNVPVNDESALRVSGVFSAQNGLRTNNFNRQPLETEDYSLRGRYVWQGAGGLKVDAAMDLNKRSTSGPNLFTSYKTVSPFVRQLYSACGIVASPENMATCGRNPDWSRTRNDGLALTLEKEFESGHVLTSVTGYRKARDSSERDLLGLAAFPVQIYFTQVDNHQSNGSQELRINSPTGGAFDYVAGLFYSEADRVNGEGPGGINAPGTVNGGLIEDSRIASKAAFGQANLHLGQQFTVFGGSRYGSMDLSSRRWIKSNVAIIPVGTGPASVSETNFSWRVGGKFDINSDTMVYSSLARGYKGPYVAFSATSATGGSVVVGEWPTSLEAGLKANLFGGKASIDINTFYTKVKNYQGQSCTVSAMGTLQCLGTNVPEVITKGIEVDIAARPARGITLNAGFIHNPVTYPAGYAGSDGVDLGGRQIAWSARDKLTLSGEYAMPVGGAEAFLSLETNYRSRTLVNTYGDNSFVTPAQWTIGGRLGARAINKSWTASLWGRNLGNKPQPVIIFLDAATGYNAIHNNSSVRAVGLNLETRF